MLQDPRTAIVHRFFSGTGSSYDVVADLCTLGFDRFWKKKILCEIPPEPARILDQACGTGILTFRIARMFPRCRVLGVELRDEYLQIARQKARVLRLDNIDFILGRAEEVVPEGPFDAVTSSYLAKYAELGILTANIKKILRPGGVVIVHDFTYPPNRLFARLWEFYFHILQTIGARVYPEWRTVFFELPEMMRKTGWVEELTRCLAENGFAGIRVRPLTWGTSAIVTARKI
jgi:demethylmenaquinone methyltransferase / 2-methoxy-6-polyprenyl-1,4-benzoquinol methylase